jgi:quinol monooxygenase YgiN
MEPLIIVAQVMAKPGRRDDVLAVLEKHAPAFHDEPGCELYALHKSADAIVIIEKWRSADDHRGHVQGAPLQKLRAEMGELLAQPSIITRVTPHPAGTERQGRL